MKVKIKLNDSKTAIAGLRVLERYSCMKTRNYLGNDLYEIDADGPSELLTGELGKYFRLWEETTPEPG